MMREQRLVVAGGATDVLAGLWVMEAAEAAVDGYVSMELLRLHLHLNLAVLYYSSC